MAIGIGDKAKKNKAAVKSNKNRGLIVYGVVFVFFIVSLFGVYSYVDSYRQEVSVLSFSQEMTSRALVEERHMVQKSITSTDFEDGMVRWEERDQYIGKYTAHYVRGNTTIYHDMFTEEPFLRTAYLYDLDSDEELLTFPYEIAEAGGRLVTPGDRLRIRGSYQKEDVRDNQRTVEDSESETMQVSEDGRIVSDIIFDVVEVVDLLNQNNQSVLDVIADANRLPQAQREELTQSGEYVNRVTPRAILMVVKTEDIDNYVEFEANDDPNYTITMLTRDESLQSQELNTGNSLMDILQSEMGDAGTDGFDNFEE